MDRRRLQHIEEIVEPPIVKATENLRNPLVQETTQTGNRPPNPATMPTLNKNTSRYPISIFAVTTVLWKSKWIPWYSPRKQKNCELLQNSLKLLVRTSLVGAGQ